MSHNSNKDDTALERATTKLQEIPPVRYNVFRAHSGLEGDDACSTYPITEKKKGLEARTIATVDAMLISEPLGLYTILLNSYDPELQRQGLLPPEKVTWQGIRVTRFWTEYTCKSIAESLAQRLTPQLPSKTDGQGSDDDSE